MRVKEPLNGIRKSQGHIIFHIAMLVASFITLRYSDSNGPISSPCRLDAMEQPEYLWNILNVIRGMHGFLIASHLFKLCFNDETSDLFIKFFEMLEVLAYVGVTLY